MAALVRFISHRVAPAAGLLAMVIVCVAAQQFAIAHEAGGHQEHTMVSPESIGYGPVNSGISSAVATLG